jgi:Protein of unknown function (DUF3710)
MAIRRREKRTEQSKLDATPPWEVRHRDAPDTTTGPYDVRDAPEDGPARIDLGALQIPVQEGIEVRLDLNETKQVISVTLANGAGQMQVSVFAAPRNEGIWDEVRAELAESLKAQGGTGADVGDGEFGVELIGTLPGDGGRVPVRFIGVDGPRWFLRAMLLGSIATDDEPARLFEEALRGVVVVRGSEPLPVREPVALQLPPEVTLPEEG